MGLERFGKNRPEKVGQNRKKSGKKNECYKNMIRLFCMGYGLLRTYGLCN